MARVQQKKLRVDDNADVEAWEWHRRPAADDVDGWLAAIDAGQVEPTDTTGSPELDLGQLDGVFDFAVVQVDAAGNRSDPASFPAWTAVPLDTTPPPAATGGVIENV
jgi:hypothetical protein